jgi:hypothetical protein
MPRVSWWLQEVKQDLDTPDLWAELKREAQLLGAGSSVVTENTVFTVDEQREIAGHLKKLGEYVSDTHSLSKAQIQARGKSSIISLTLRLVSVGRIGSTLLSGRFLVLSSPLRLPQSPRVQSLRRFFAASDFFIPSYRSLSRHGGAT